MFLPSFLRGRVFLGGEFADFQGSLQLLTSSHLRERDNMLLRAILCGGFGTSSFLGKAKKEDVPCRFRGKRDGDGHSSWERPFPPPSSTPGNSPNSLTPCLLIAANGHVAHSRMVGCLALVVLVKGIPGPPPLVI